MTRIHQSTQLLPTVASIKDQPASRRHDAEEEAALRQRLIHELVEEQVRRVPGETAVIYKDKRVKYAELNSRANHLANYLLRRGVTPDQLVGIYIDRSDAMVVAMLGVLKAGAAYVPMDPAYPAERLMHMLQDAGPPIILTQEVLKDTLPPAEAQVISVDGDRSAIEECPNTNLASAALGLTPLNLAYVIYTSGSTGTPKGVMNEHRGMVNRIISQREFENFSATDICCQKTSISFVDAVFEIFGALCHGLPLVVIPKAAVDDVLEMAALIAKEHVTRLVTVPSLAQSMVDSPEVMLNLSCLRSWTLSGEEVRGDLLMTLQRRLPECEFIIQYGSSEVSSDATIFKSNDFDGGRVPLGRPLPNVQVHVLDERGQQAQAGVVGEIFVGGIGVGRGYLNRPELTSTRFLPDPFGHGSTARLYRTGDLGRWREGRVLEYLGRADQQVKIRGFRIEPSEVESRALQLRQIREAVVVAREDDHGEKRLVAYVTLRSDGHVTMGASEGKQPADRVKLVDMLRSYLRTSLPEYMIPAAVVVMDKLPLTPNGKVDRRALPPPGTDAYPSRHYEAPCGEIELTLARIWTEVLHIDQVGRRDNFFELGGHSLLIVQMMRKLRGLGLPCTVRQVFESPTLADLANALAHESVGEVDVPPNLIPANAGEIAPHMLPLVTLESDHIERVVRSVRGGVENIQDIYPLAPLQEGMLFHYLLDDQSGDAYVMPSVLSVSSRERLNELIAALQAVIDRHDILRTAVVWEQLPHPVQVVCRRACLPVEEIAFDIGKDLDEQIGEWIKPERQRMDLRQAPLVRLQVAFDGPRKMWYAVLRLHHIVYDDVSLRILIAETVAHLEKRTEDLQEATPFRSHVSQTLRPARVRDAEAFFRRKLSDVDEPTAPFGLVDVHGDVSRIDEVRQEIAVDLAQRVRALARRLSVSVATLFHAAWGLVVACTTGRHDVVFGSVLLGRLQGNEGENQIVGMFVNTLPLRLRLQNVSVRELVIEVQKGLVELLSHEQASLAVAQRCSSIAGSMPLFSTVLNYRHDVIDPEAEWARARGIRLLATQDRTNYPITMSLDDLGIGFAITAQTDRRVDPRRVCDYLLRAVEELVEALEHSPQKMALLLPILPENEWRQVTQLPNAGQVLYPRNALVHELFEQQVNRTPNAIAVIHEESSLTYAELNARADRLARHLVHRGLAPGGLVAICVERSVEMVVAILGTLKAGGAYVPLDPSYPSDRLRYMLETAAPYLVLTQEKLMGVLPPMQVERIALDREWTHVVEHSTETTSTFDLALNAQHAVYVIFTSGSTGRPKGTVMTHFSMVNLIEWHRRTFVKNESKRVLQFAALSFDVAFQEIFSTLCLGDCLVLLDEWLRRDGRALARFLADQSVQRLFIPPLMLESLAECVQTSGAARSLSLEDVITAGEQLRITLPIRRLFDELNGCRLHNHYGPTESHVVTALTLVGNPHTWPDRPAIGQPISNAEIYILNHQRQPMPLGVAGEIYIGGAGVAQGYLRRPELTAERFYPNPFTNDPASRMYRTGDLGRWQLNGTLEYVGRNDDQVKIRGYRVELGEIEEQLALHDHVREVAVVVREDAAGEKRLVAYFTRDRHSLVSAADLQRHLQTVLPEHMVPACFVALERLPLSVNGKLDRRALPDPEFGAGPSVTYEAPQGEIENAIAAIWRDLLQINCISRHQNFFEIGGHSLLATRVITRISHALDIDIPLRVIFEKPTVEALTRHVVQQMAAEMSMEEA